MQMSERTLLASVALFRELYDNQKDIYDVISELIKASLVFSKAHLTDATHAANLIKQHFELRIPEAVVNTALKQRLCKRDRIVSKINNGYAVNSAGLNDMGQHIINDFKALRENQETFINGLEKYIESRRGVLLSEDKKTKLAESVCDYFFEGKKRSDFEVEISGFIIHNKGDNQFTERLNAVREGFVLYDGVRHSSDLGQIGSWSAPLTVYLDTENLFNAVGLNGDLHRQLVKDFLSLASDVKIKGSRAIAIKYFTECFDEIDRFFHAARAIVDGKGQLDPSKPAMVSIIDGCSKKSDVLAKKAKFFAELERIGISKCELSIGAVDTTFNLESEDLQSSIEGDLGTSDRDFNKEKCSNLLQMFTKINALRHGKNAGPFESVGHVLLCESFLAKYLSYHRGVADENGGITYSVDLEFITNRLWFKLNKGLGRDLAHPQSLSVLAKAQVVLSSQVNSSISSQYDDLNRRYKDGGLDSTEASYLLDSLRAKSTSPEDIDESNVDSVVDFISKSDLESARRERSLLLAKVEEGAKAIAALGEINGNALKKKTRRVGALSVAASAVILLSFTIFLVIMFSKYVGWLAESADTTLGKVGFFVTCASAIFGIIKIRSIFTLCKLLNNFILRRLMSYFDI